MSKKLGVLGLALVAVFAMSAMLASAAQASNFQSGTGTYPTTVTGEQVSGEVTKAIVAKHEFKSVLGIVKCTPTTFTGTLTAASSEFRVAPTYGNTTAGTGCTIAGVAGPVVHMFGCEYLFTAGTTASGVTPISTHLVCPVGQHVVITIRTGCELTIFPQTFPETTISAKNGGGTGSAMTSTDTIDVTGITNEIDEESAGKCPEHKGVLAGELLHEATTKGVAEFKNLTVA
jgi:hypothetical protein